MASSHSGIGTQSSSVKRIIVPQASRAPRLRAAAGPAFAWLMRRTPEKRSTAPTVLSVEPSLPTRISIFFGGVCLRSASRQVPMRQAPLKVGIMIEASIGIPLDTFNIGGRLLKDTIVGLQA